MYSRLSDNGCSQSCDCRQVVIIMFRYEEPKINHGHRLFEARVKRRRSKFAWLYRLKPEHELGSPCSKLRQYGLDLDFIVTGFPSRCIR